VNGVISGAASLGKTGAGTLALNNANTFSGGVNLTGGTLSIGNNAALGTGALGMGAGTTLDFGITGLALGNTIALNGAASLNAGAGISGAVNGVISGAASLGKTGAGTLALNNANTFSGGVNLTGGTLSIGNNTALGAGALGMERARRSTSASPALRSATPLRSTARPRSMQVRGSAVP